MAQLEFGFPGTLGDPNDAAILALINGLAGATMVRSWSSGPYSMGSQGVNTALRYYNIDVTNVNAVNLNRFKANIAPYSTVITRTYDYP